MRTAPITPAETRTDLVYCGRCHEAMPAGLLAVVRLWRATHRETVALCRRCAAHTRQTKVFAGEALVAVQVIETAASYADRSAS